MASQMDHLIPLKLLSTGSLSADKQISIPWEQYLIRNIVIPLGKSYYLVQSCGKSGLVMIVNFKSC